MKDEHIDRNEQGWESWAAWDRYLVYVRAVEALGAIADDFEVWLNTPKVK